MEASIKPDRLTAEEQRAAVAPEGYFFIRNEPISTAGNYAHGVRITQQLGPNYKFSAIAFDELGEPLPLGQTIAVYERIAEPQIEHQTHIGRVALVSEHHL